MSFKLIVNDGTEDSLPTSVVVTANKAPMAEAGANQTVQVNTLVTMDGSESSDPDSDPLTFQWTFTSQPAGSAATLTNPTSVGPTFVPDVIGNYTVELVVNDGTDDSAPDSVIITAEKYSPCSRCWSRSGRLPECHGAPGWQWLIRSQWRCARLSMEFSEPADREYCVFIESSGRQAYLCRRS